MGTFHESQIKEMANGMENSGNRFLWSLHKRPSPTEGKVWVPTKKETFVEALPDGFLERLAVEIMMGYRLEYKTKVQNFTVTAKDVENGVNKLMSLDEERKDKVREMRDKSRKALEEDGSSHKHLSHFIQDVLTSK
ncbi:UDP-glycosyltransferase 71A15 [Bienertia sinuspersici]